MTYYNSTGEQFALIPACNVGTMFLTDAQTQKTPKDLWIFLAHLRECRRCTPYVQKATLAFVNYLDLRECSQIVGYFDYIYAGKIPPEVVMDQIKEHLYACPYCNPYGYCPTAEMASITLASYEGEMLQHEIDALVEHQKTCPMCRRSLDRLEKVAVDMAMYSAAIGYGPVAPLAGTVNYPQNGTISGPMNFSYGYNAAAVQVLGSHPTTPVQYIQNHKVRRKP